MVQIISHPCIPFTTTIGGGMYPGRSAVIRGVPKCGPEKRFIVEFVTCTGSIPMCFNPRFGFGGCWQTIMNSSAANGCWLNEERHNNNLQIGVPFELQIFVEQDKYCLKINGCHYCDFRHREPVCNVNALRITGDIHVEYIKFPDTSPYPNIGAFGGIQPVYHMPMQQAPGFPFNQQPFNQKPFHQQPQCQEFNCPGTPFMAMICGGFNAPRRITVIGTPRMCADRFSVNLKSNHEFLFHFNPRFRHGCGGEVVRNSTRCGGAWLCEERCADSFPFCPNQTFSMDIYASGTFYNVTVNGRHFVSFATRDDPCLVNQLTIDGDITIQKVIIL